MFSVDTQKYPHLSFRIYDDDKAVRHFEWELNDKDYQMSLFCGEEKAFNWTITDVLLDRQGDSASVVERVTFCIQGRNIRLSERSIRILGKSNKIGSFVTWFAKQLPVYINERSWTGKDKVDYFVKSILSASGIYHPSK